MTRIPTTLPTMGPTIDLSLLPPSGEGMGAAGSVSMGHASEFGLFVRGIRMGVTGRVDV